MPLVVNYNIAARKNRFFVGAGPTLSYGLSGKDKQTFFTHDAFGALFKRFDGGLRVQAGFRPKNVQFSAVYDLGLFNIFDNDNPNLPPGQTADWRNNMLGVSVAYLFSLKK